MVDQAKETSGQVAEQAKQQATSQLESQKERAVDTLVTVGQALRQTGQHLHEQEQTAVGGYIEQAAERVETLTNYLRTRDVTCGRATYRRSWWKRRTLRVVGPAFF